MRTVRQATTRTMPRGCLERDGRGMRRIGSYCQPDPGINSCSPSCNANCRELMKKAICKVHVQEKRIRLGGMGREYRDDCQTSIPFRGPGQPPVVYGDTLCQ